MSDPLIEATTVALHDVGAILLLPMTRAGDKYGWILLGKSAGIFSTDDERLGVAAAAQIRAIHENLKHSDLLSRQRERIEEELLTSRENLAAIFNASPVSIIAFDRDGIVQAWNRAAERILGWTAEEIIGRRNPDVPPEGDDQYGTMIAQCLAGATLKEVEVRRQRKEGARIDVTVSMAPLHDALGVVRGCVSITTDVTERKRTEIELRDTSARLRALSARLLSVLEDERTRISRELHDDLGQLLTAIKIDVSRLLLDIANGTAPTPNLQERILPLIDSTLKTVGRIVVELRPSRIGEVGLVTAIDRKLADFQKRTDIECELSFRPEQIRVPDAVGTAAFRILEEALTNVARHSGATRVEVRIRHDRPSELLFEIRDNGRGILDAELSSEMSYGLMGMRERAYVLGGSVTISGIEGKGTIVTARIPVEDRK
jgi:PAS domain S-box-containing protein